MSADFISVVAWPKQADARRLVAQLAAQKSVMEDVVDSSGSSVFDPRSAEPFKPRKLAALVGRAAAAAEDFSTAYVGIDAALFDGLVPSETAMSPNFPSIVVVDRALAIPNGVSLMRGRSFIRLRPKAVARLHAEWPRVIARSGESKKIAKQLAPYLDRWGNGYRDIQQALFALSVGIRRATELGHDLVLAGATMP